MMYALWRYAISDSWKESGTTYRLEQFCNARLKRAAI